MQKEDLAVTPEAERPMTLVEIQAEQQRTKLKLGPVYVSQIPPDPKTKYLRKAYPVDGQVHTDANGNQYVLIDVYTVLQAFAVSSHALGHAIKKLLCAGIRGKGGKVQDLEESKVAIDRGIQEAKLEGAK